MSTLAFSAADVLEFAAWSADRNPLHVDPTHARQTHFGRTVAHGVLTVLGATRAEVSSDSRRVSRVDVEFRQAVFPDEVYETEAAFVESEWVLGLRNHDQLVLGIRVGFGDLPTPANDLSWVTAATRPVRDVPADSGPEDFRRGAVISGSYPCHPPRSFASGALGATAARVLALSSYVTGMESPGLRSLFTRLSVELHADASDDDELRYRATTTRFDQTFRILDTELTVASATGRLIATAQLRAYVPFSPVQTDLQVLAARVAPATEQLSGKVALVTGGSRGLGADIASGLALAGAQVYVSARHDDDARKALHDELRDKGASVQFIEGDAGDPAWCERALDAIRARHGRLDVLVLNACAPPTPQPVDRASARAREQYVRDNLRLVEAPLDAFIGALAESGGTVTFVSSSFVQDTPPGFSHYVALKQAGEALVRTVARERKNVAGLIARPPVLQTRWNDTPSGVVGSIPADWAAAHLVAALASVTPGSTAMLEAFPAFPDVAKKPVASTPALTVRLAASFTTDPLVPALNFWLNEVSLSAGVEVAPYGQVLQSLLDPSSILNARGAGANVLLLRVRDWLRELPAGQVADIDRVRPYLQQTAQDFEAAVRAHRAQAGAETLLMLCPSYGAASSAESILIRQTEQTIAANLAAVPGLQIVAATAFHPHYHVNEDDAHDELRDHIAHIPYRDDYLHVLAALVVRHVHRRLAPVRKVVAVDCDNTLWRGVVGEVGAEGLEFDAGHRALHALLTRLTENGVLVCLCSKNEEPDVWRVFDTRSELGLRRDHVVAAMINWQPKSQNLRTLAARLNLGLDSFVFLDDNPVECAEVRSGCPEVLTVQWPQDARQAELLTRHIWELDGGKATQEDAKRTALYKDEFKRQEARADTLTFEDFIKKLQLEVDFAPLSDEDLRRSAQLTLRTNQFNFTTIRREEADVQALAAAGRHEIRTVRVRDRFGDYGLVGLVIAERGSEAWTLDTFLLSCRVLGRGVEHRIMSDLGQMAAAAGAGHVRMRVETTKRNTPARSFFESVIPEAFRHGDQRAVEAEVPVDALSAVHFEPAVVGEVVVQDEGGSKAAQPVDASQLRQREEQITRAAFALSTGQAMRAAAEGRAAPAVAAAQSAVGEADVAAVVHAAFATALRVPVERVVEVDGLEALGCDSLRIVEITVALSERYPWLPGTLLFEHRSVSQIVREIVRLAQPETGAVPVPGSARARAAIEPVRQGGGVAVVGIGVRCAGANSPAELWRLLRDGRSSVGPVSADRPYFLRPLVDDRSHWAGLLDGVGRFDPEFFGVSPREAEVMDPQLRLFLEVAWSALEDAGAAGTAHEPNTGVFAGVMYGDYGYRANAGTKAAGSPYRSWEGFSLANRLSQLLGFHGPSFAVETACSSSGTALHLACSALKAGECAAAVVGGVNLILDPDRFGSLGRLGILSARGVCEPFGADADGTVLGEGAGVVVLRPLADALSRGDRIYGVIKGTGLSTGSGTVGFTAPNPQAQAEAIRRSLRVAGIDPRTVSYIETHGTGTLLGDPIEIRGLSLAYGDPGLQEPGVAIEHRCAIGSLKPNIGHLEAGAGVLGLIKILLQLTHRTLVPSLTSPQPSPQIPFAQVPFSVQRALSEWPQPTIRLEGEAAPVPRRAGLNSFGVGGANAHLIVEEAPSVAADEPERPTRPLDVLALSGHGPAALARQVQAVKAFIDAAPDTSVGDLCHSINVGRRHLPYRTAIAAADRDELLERLKAWRPAEKPVAATRPKVAFLFTGQGSQYAGMGRTLYETQPVFREALNQCARVFDVLLGRSLRELLFAAEGTGDADLLNQTGFTQPALFAFQYALARLWRSWGVVPDVVMGHSVGEIAAMCVAGGVSLEDGLTLIAARGRLMQALPAGGVMTSVMADEARVQAALEGARELVAIAAVNAPGQVVISGADTAVAEISARLSADGIKTKALTVSHAFHSPLMKPMLADYERVVRGIRFSPPAIPLVSCVDGAVAGEALITPEYWLRQVMDPVRFAAGMRVLEAEGVGAFVEIGPHPVLIGMGRQCVADESQSVWVPSLRRNADAWQTIGDSACKLYEEGVDFDWSGFDAPYRRTRVSAPTFAFSEREDRLKHVPVLDEAVVPGNLEDSTPAGPQLYDLTWQHEPRSAATVAGGAWVVFADRMGVAQALVAELEAQGGTAIIVRAASRFVARDNEFEIDLRDPEQYVRVLASVAPGSALHVVHLWSVDLPATRDLDAASLESAHAASSLSMIHLANALTARDAAGAASRLTVVTSGAVSPPDDLGPLALAQASVWGFGRTMALEHPEFWGALIDLDPEDLAQSGRHLAAELLAESLEDQVALRGAQRFVARLVHSNQAPAEMPPLASDGVYLVTGGVGALGLRTASWLVDRGARHVVLTSRHADPSATSPEVRELVSSLQSRGAEIQLVAADVSQPADVDRLFARIASSPHRLRGIVHAAGTDSTVPLSVMTEHDLHDAFAAKAAGAWLLHKHTVTVPVDMFVCFSSVASVLGSQGRAHYGAANAFLDALGAERRRAGQPVTVVNWGPWRGGGMATEEHLRQFERIGNRGLDPAAAVGMLDAAIGGGGAQVIVADIDWDLFAPAYSARRERPILAALQPGREDPSTDRSAEFQAPWVARLSRQPEARRERELMHLVQQEVAETMGFDEADSVPADRSFYELGVDSLMMADLVGRIRKQVGFSCSTMIFDHPTVRDFSRELLPRLAGTLVGSALSGADGQASDLDRAGSLGEAQEATEGYDSTSAAEVFSFQATAWPHRDPSLIPGRWRWMFVDSARRLGREPKVWIHKAGDRVVGHMGSIAVRLKAGADILDTGWLVDTMVADDYRSRGLGSRLMVQAHEDQPFSLSLGQTSEMREIQFRLGWQQVAHLETAQLLIRPENVIRGKLPKPAAFAAGLGLRASSAIRDLFRPASHVTVRPVDRFDHRHDELWHAVSSSVTCAVVRDAAYLNWKYVDQPGQHFIRLEILDSDRLLGVVVLVVREPSAPYRYRRVFLVDLVAPFSNHEALVQVVQAAATQAAERGADALLCLHIGAALTRALKACGFALRRPERVLLVDDTTLPAPTRELLADGANWLVTQGDSDIDRPW